AAGGGPARRSQAPGLLPDGGDDDGRHLEGNARTGGRRPARPGGIGKAARRHLARRPVGEGRLMRRAAILLLALAGCTTVGPDYQEPALAVPDRFLGGSSAGQSELGQWWTMFGDSTLDELVGLALQENLDI